MAKKRYKVGGLIKFIDLANLLPADAELPDPRELEPAGKHAALLAEIAEKFYRRFLPRRPPSRRELERKFEPNPNSPFFGYYGGQAVSVPAELRLYPFFWTVRAILRSLAEAGRAMTEGTTRGATGFPLPPIVPLVRIEPDGTLRMGEFWDDVHSTFAPALEGADVRRIKTCPACGKLFWANPSHKGACDEHLGSVRIRRYREKQKQYEQTRKLKRASK
jgi:hypothetical protein